jgi:hypothetical protein
VATKEAALNKAQAELASLQAKHDALAAQHAGVDERGAELKAQAEELQAQVGAGMVWKGWRRCRGQPWCSDTCVQANCLCQD